MIEGKGIDVEIFLVVVGNLDERKFINHPFVAYASKQSNTKVATTRGVTYISSISEDLSLGTLNI